MRLIRLLLSRHCLCLIWLLLNRWHMQLTVLFRRLPLDHWFLIRLLPYRLCISLRYRLCRLLRRDRVGMI